MSAENEILQLTAPEALFECKLHIFREGSSSGMQHFEMGFSGEDGLGSGVAHSLQKLAEFISCTSEDRDTMEKISLALEFQERAELGLRVLDGAKLSDTIPLRPFSTRVILRRKGSVDEREEHRVELLGSRTFVHALDMGKRLVLGMQERAAEIEKAILEASPS